MQCSLWTVYHHLQSFIIADFKAENIEIVDLLLLLSHMKCIVPTDCTHFIDFVRAHTAYSRHHIVQINMNKIRVRCWSMTHHKHKHTHIQTHPGCEQQWHWHLFSGIRPWWKWPNWYKRTLMLRIWLISYYWLTIKFHSWQPSFQHVSGNQMIYNIYFHFALFRNK